MAGTEKYTYYIIVNHKRNAIWKGLYASRDEAQAELDAQLKKLPKGQHGRNWKVEERVGWRKPDKDFKEFEKPYKDQ